MTYTVVQYKNDGNLDILFLDYKFLKKNNLMGHISDQKLY